MFVEPWEEKNNQAVDTHTALPHLLGRFGSCLHAVPS